MVERCPHFKKIEALEHEPAALAFEVDPVGTSIDASLELCVEDVVVVARSHHEMEEEKHISDNNAKLFSAKTICNYVWEILILDVFLREIPSALIMSVPVLIHDAFIAYVVKPQHGIEFASRADLEHKLATFNMHASWVWWGDERPGSLGNYSIHVLSYAWAQQALYLLTYFLIPYSLMDRETYWKLTTKRTIAVFALQAVFSIGTIIWAAIRASDAAGTHHYDVYKTIPPVIPSVIVFGIMAYHRGRSIQRETGSVAIKPALFAGFFCAVFFTAEVVFIVGGFSTLSLDDKEFVLFIYRLIIWPFFWYLGLMPLTRFCMFNAPSKESVLPITIYMLVAISTSSRIVMFRMTSLKYFFALSFCDTLFQVSMNMYDGKLPIVDKVLYKFGWLRCLQRPEVSWENAKWVRVIWFQTATLVEIIIIICIGFREWAFFDSRYLFTGLYQPSCNNSFEFTSLLYKIGISLLLVVCGDLYTGYKTYARKYPVSETIKFMLGKKRTWGLIIVNQLSVFALIVMPLAPVPARSGGCTDFDNGCTCQNIAVFREICGCCSANATIAGMYQVCK
eukprot:TRINITY_DN6590_c1_g5_i1.p1 TRINITY_DN6590_c1_g5~~TRINITY_DN6590_c1_g5_i1.p1  ORF type:complete len:564 (-),score=60.43 TRINITY_DN6590_c1_g5_i1:300-1991(-)